MDTEVLHPSSLGYWDPESDDQLLCIDVHHETHDVKSFTFVSRDRRMFSFEAGQYFLFEPEIDGSDEGRCCSVSSSPKRQNRIAITVKRVPGGKVSNWMHDNLRPDDLVRASGPLGAFIRPPASKYVFLTGGSGITPVMSMVRQLADEGRPIDVVFVHAGRTPKDLVFRDELANLASRLKGLKLSLLPEDTANERSWYDIVGRISREFLLLAAPDMAEKTVMCCGPAPFMAARRLSAEIGVPPNAISRKVSTPPR
jgi:glycine betaine catabolism B